MDLRIKLQNDGEYGINLVQGISFSDQFNETLDSATIKIVNVEKLNIKPFDDAFIYDYNPDFVFNGYPLSNEEKEKLNFYKHFLVDSFSEEMVYFGDENRTPRYDYVVTLFSEIKRMEKIMVPNLSITLPLYSKKRSIYDYAARYLEMYSPKFRVKIGENIQFRQKYTLAPELVETFGNVYPNENSVVGRNLREVLYSLFILLDKIPYVRDDVVYALDISKTIGKFDIYKGERGYIRGAMSSSDYGNNIRTTYSNALGQEFSTRSVEFVGFRNSDTPLMTLDNMRLELNFPIYKINRILLCYNKTIVINGEEKHFLCKQDITPLVKLESERQHLFLDWEDWQDQGFDTFINSLADINDFAKYKMATIGYSIGSKYITGWGTKFTYPRGWWGITQHTSTYIENVMRIVDTLTPLGIYGIGIFTDGKAVSSFENVENGVFINSINPFDGSGIAEKLKSCFFEVDYQSFYNGTIVHSKNFGEVDEDLTINDNPSSPMPVLDRDGVAQIEKLERFGNKGITLNYRYYNIEDVQEVGTEVEINGEKAIVYSREMSIYDNVINVVYRASAEYVLRNYYTSVYARHRTYSLMSYGEAVRRSENVKKYIVLSDKKYNDVVSNINYYGGFVADMLSGITESDVPKNTNEFYNDKLINTAYLNSTYRVFDAQENEFDDKQSGNFAMDINSFASGNSIVFNCTMNDNILAGTYIKDFTPEFNADVTDDFTGSVQNQYYLTTAEENGEIRNLNFKFGHRKNTLELWEDEDNNYVPSNWKEFSSNLMALPKLNDVSGVDRINVQKTFYKDNREYIDLSLQFELISDKKNLLFSNWFLKLSDLITPFYKQKKDISLVEMSNTTYTNKREQNRAFSFFAGGFRTNINIDPNITKTEWISSSRMYKSPSLNDKSGDVLHSIPFYMIAIKKDIFENVPFDGYTFKFDKEKTILEYDSNIYGSSQNTPSNATHIDSLKLKIEEIAMYPNANSPYLIVKFSGEYTKWGNSKVYYFDTINKTLLLDNRSSMNGKKQGKYYIYSEDYIYFFGNLVDDIPKEAGGVYPLSSIGVYPSGSLSQEYSDIFLGSEYMLNGNGFSVSEGDISILSENYPYYITQSYDSFQSFSPNGYPLVSYNKTLFYCVTKNDIDKSIIYQELENLEDYAILTEEEVNIIRSSEGLNITLNSGQDGEYNFLVFYRLLQDFGKDYTQNAQGKYYFVFGLNNVVDGSHIINASILESKDIRVYDERHNKIGTIETID